MGLILVLVVVLLHLVWPVWVAVLVVAVLVFVAAGGAALAGRAQLRRAVPPALTQAAVGVAADVHAVTQAVRERRQQ